MPAESGDDLFVSALDLLFAVVAFMDEHRRKRIMLVRSRALRYGPRGSSVGLRAGESARRRWCSPVAVPRPPSECRLSLVMTGSNLSSSFFSTISPTASRMTFACSERSCSIFSSNLPNSAFRPALVTGASALFRLFSIHIGLHLKHRRTVEAVNGVY